MRKKYKCFNKVMAAAVIAGLYLCSSDGVCDVKIDTQNNTLEASLDEESSRLDNNVNTFFGLEWKFDDGYPSVPVVQVFAENNGVKFGCTASRSVLGVDFNILESLAMHLGKMGQLWVTNSSGVCTKVSFLNLNNYVPKSWPSVNRDYGLMFPEVQNSTAYKPCAPRVPITFGVPFAGALSKNDCISDSFYFENGYVFDKAERYADRYTFSAQPNQKIAISLSGSFDTFVVLKDENGGVIARNDNGGGGTNSRIPSSTGFLTLPDEKMTSGKFIVEVTSRDFGDLRSGSPQRPLPTGSYSLLVTKQ